MTGSPGKRRRSAPVKVTRADGEVETVTSSTIRRRARRRTDQGVSLTVDQRRQLFNGGHPRIVVGPDCKLGPGDVYDLPGTKGFWLGITGVKGEGEERELVYAPHDDRSRLLRASVHGVDFDAIRRSYDDRGHPMPLTDQASVDQAAEESGYTSSPGAALPLEPEAIARDDYEAMVAVEREEREERIRHKIRRAHEAIGGLEEDDDFKGVQSSVRFLKNLVRKLEDELLQEQREGEQ